ncbi:MAG: hypothetical protein ACPGOY_02945 [Rhodospirillaceae bacterium]
MSTGSDNRAADIQCLLAALNEVQQTIRAYDTKAQIVGVGFIFSISMIGPILQQMQVTRTYDLGFLIGTFVFLIGPVVLFGSVLYPTRRTAPEITSQATGLATGKTAAVHGFFYVPGDGNTDIAADLAKLEGVDWRAEILYELSRLSALRALKRRRFLRAMTAAGISFLLILLTQGLKLLFGV